jgi:hypothetical protein
VAGPQWAGGKADKPRDEHELSCSATGSICTGETISLEEWTQLYGWHNDVSLHAFLSDVDGYTECLRVEQVEGALYCMSDSRRVMNRIFNRASKFIEGLYGNPAGTVIPSDSTLPTRVVGHDLQGDDLVRFFAAVKELCDDGEEEYCLTVAEEELYETVLLPAWEQGDDFVVLASASCRASTTTHEMLHAQFFLDPVFAATVMGYYRAMEPEERARVRDLLESTYDVTNERLMANEFQAYVLMTDADEAKLYELVDEHREPLTDALARNGRVPFQL